jgi:hypothetical protein
MAPDVLPELVPVAMEIVPVPAAADGPVDRLSDPLLPPVTPPLPKDTAPLLPLAVLPVPRTNAPLALELATAFEVRIVMAPVDADVLAPDNSVTDPPTCELAVALPADNMMRPPVPAPELPTKMDTAPAAPPAVVAPVDK